MRSKILLVFILLSFFVKPIKSLAQVNVQDSLALVDFYDSTYGVSPWQFGQSWDLQNPVSTWTGIGSNNRVVSIRIWGGGRSGSERIPSSFGNLTALQSIEFLDFDLSATLPESFENLISLKSVYFHAVFGPGPSTFPASLTKVPNLEVIDMEDNYFTDSIPLPIGNIRNLVALGLMNCGLSGTIPNSLNRLDSLKGMDLSNNHYTFKEIAPFINDYVNSHKTYNLTYSPQANIPVHRYKNRLAVSAGDTLNNDTFTWYKDSVLVATITGDSTYFPSDTGRYYVTVTNSIATDLILYGDEFTLHYIMPDSAVSATQNITGISAVNVTKGIFEIVKLQSTAGTNQLSGNVTASVNVDTSVSTYHSQPYVQRHYDITPTVNAANAQATVTLYFTQQDFDNFNNYVTANNLNLPLLPSGGVDNGKVRITQFHGSFTGSSDPANYNNQNAVLIIPTSVVWDNTNQWWAITFPVIGFSGFFLSTANSALPLTLLDFKGKLRDNGVMLQWLTTNEVSTKEFIIERSANGNLFNVIGNVTAQSTQITNVYNFTDSSPMPGNNFYRLQMTDKDDKFSYSGVIKLNFTGTIFGLKIYPNPASSVLNVKIESGKTGSIVLKITDGSGKSIITKKISVDNTITHNFFNVENFAGWCLLFER